MSDNTIPEYLQPALAQLEKARAAHLENARLMDETVTAIERQSRKKMRWRRPTETTLTTGARPFVQPVVS